VASAVIGAPFCCGCNRHRDRLARDSFEACSLGSSRQICLRVLEQRSAVTSE
jgi:hypothetical protein